jgi:hypothetical protein
LHQNMRLRAVGEGKRRGRSEIANTRSLFICSQPPLSSTPVNQPPS